MSLTRKRSEDTKHPHPSSHAIAVVCAGRRGRIRDGASQQGTSGACSLRTGGPSPAADTNPRHQTPEVGYLRKPRSANSTQHTLVRAGGRKRKWYMHMAWSAVLARGAPNATILSQHAMVPTISDLRQERSAQAMTRTAAMPTQAPVLRRKAFMKRARPQETQRAPACASCS